MRKPSRRQLFIGAGIGAALLVAAIIALPLVGAHYLQEWLRQQGAATATVEDINFNPFTGRAELTGLVANGDSARRLEVDRAVVNLRWWPLASRRLYIEEITLSGARADVVYGDNGEISIGGLLFANANNAEPTPADENPSSPPWGVGSEALLLENIALTYQDGHVDSQLDINRVTLGSHFSWQQGHRMDLGMDVAINGAPLVIGGEVAPWADSPDFAGNLSLADLQLAGFEPLLAKVSPLQNVRGTLGLDLDFSGRYAADGRLALQISGPLTLSAAGLALDNLALTQQTLNWNGTIALNLPPASGEPMATVKGTLDAGSTAAREAIHPLQATLDRLNWQGSIQVTTADDADAAPVITANMGVTAGGLAVEHTETNIQLAAVDQLTAEALTLSGIDTITLADLTLTQLQLLGTANSTATGDSHSGSQTLAIQQLHGQSLEIANQQIHLAALTIDEPVVSLLRNSTGAFEQITPLQQAFSNRANDAPATTTDTATDTASTATPTPCNFQ